MKKEYAYSGGFDLEFNEYTTLYPEIWNIIEFPFEYKLKKNEAATIVLRSRYIFNDEYDMELVPSIIDYGWTKKIRAKVKYIPKTMRIVPLRFVKGQSICQLVIFKIPKIKGSNKERK